MSFDIDELVFQYESLCHSINERADQVGTLIPPRDQQCLNTALDECIARTVIEWEQEKRKSRATTDSQRLGSVEHELREALHTAALSFQAIRSGSVPVEGSTAEVVERSLERLRTLIETLFAENRLEA